ncbi:hypothetical protein [Enterobacter hormaechei]|uniref:hypothetical protein n=1 Tax=Enterobacter hormaechei TaxID=158836 RepID=UPI001D127AF6|nr:hypothetical protein [Enterobacter hormaechei]MCC2917660.1 hypothetical protein [Enterobacter hormaechei]
MKIDIDRRVILALNTLKKREINEVNENLRQFNSEFNKKASIIRKNIGKNPLVRMISEGSERRLYSYGKDNRIKLIFSIPKSAEDEISVVDIAYPEQVEKE